MSTLNTVQLGMTDLDLGPRGILVELDGHAPGQITSLPASRQALVDIASVLRLEQAARAHDVGESGCAPREIDLQVVEQ